MEQELFFREVIIMRKSIECTETGISKMALQVTKSNVNSACVFFIYQPKLPKAAKKLQKL